MLALLISGSSIDNCSVTYYTTLTFAQIMNLHYGLDLNLHFRHDSVIHLHFKSFKIYVKNDPSPKTKTVPKVMKKMEQLETLV